MRAEIQARLISQLPEIAGRCYQLHEVTLSTPKPYLVLLQRKEEQEEPWRGIVRYYEVRCYGAMTSFHEVDALMDKVMQALNGQVLTEGGTGAAFTCRYEGTHRSDEVDTTLAAIDRRLRFSVYMRKPGETDSTAVVDPWLEALAMWTNNQLGSEWKVYRNMWPANYAMPTVLWRLADVDMQERGSAMYQMRKKIVGHVLGRTPTEQNSKALELVSKLIGSRKIILDVAANRYATVVAPTLQATIDEMVQGQITLTLSRIIDRSQGDSSISAPLIGGVNPKAVIY